MDKRIYAGEWQLMECLWAQAPRTLMELVRAMAEKTGWAKSTVTTMVTRMEQKGLLRFEQEGRTKKIYPAVSRREAVSAETGDLLNKAYHGSAGLLMTTLVQKNRLTRQELDELYDLLRRAEEDSHG